MNRTYQDLFTTKAGIYQVARPHYAPALLDALVDRGVLTPDVEVADVGCGTGILASQIRPLVAHVFGVEPNAAMLDQARSLLGSTRTFTPVAGSAEATTLPPSSVDVVTAGQAFHWFDLAGFSRESRRILRPGGWTMLTWNHKQACAMEEERARIVARYRAVLDSFGCSWERREQAISRYFGGAFEKLSFPNPLVEEWPQFIERTLSASHALEPDDARFDEYIGAWRVYFDRFARDGRIVIPNNTVAYLGHPADLG